jgi:hypothetical protein
VATEPSSSAVNRGLEDGAAYASAHLADRARLGRIVRAHTAAEVMANVEATVQMPDGVDEPAYWSGFAHGVLRILQSTRTSFYPQP